MNVYSSHANEPSVGPDRRPAFVYRHVVTFEETNVVGNVYFTHHLAWQGRCRELFLKQHAPEMLAALTRDLRLVTLRVSCEYFEELSAFDEIELHMTLAYARQHRLGLEFEIERRSSGRQICVARGSQELGCMRLGASGLVPFPLPAELTKALRPFSGQRRGGVAG